MQGKIANPQRLPGAYTKAASPIDGPGLQISAETHQTTANILCFAGCWL
jgi:hypothetical protein